MLNTLCANVFRRKWRDIELLNCVFSKVYEYQDGSSGFTCPTLEEQTCGRVKKNTSAASSARPKRVYGG